MAHAEEKEGLLSRSICCIVVRPPPPSLAAPPEGTITTTGPDDHQVLSTFRVFPHRRRRRLRKNLLPPSHVPRHYSPEISTICVSALRPISLRDPHRFAGEGEEESHLLREANCDLDDFLRPGGGWGGSNWCCSKRKDGRIDLLEIGVIVSLIIIFHRVCYVHYFYLFYPFVLDFTKDNIGDKILQVLLHNNSKKK